jgi:hypothetical protein
MSSGAEISDTEVRWATKTDDACENNSCSVGTGFPGSEEQAYPSETCPIDIATNEKAKIKRGNIEIDLDMGSRSGPNASANRSRAMRAKLHHA